MKTSLNRIDTKLFSLGLGFHFLCKINNKTDTQMRFEYRTGSVPINEDK